MHSDSFLVGCMVDSFGLNRKYPVDENTMHQVSCLPMAGGDPKKELKAKDVSHKAIYTKYSTRRGYHGVMIVDTNDQRDFFST
jgi:hypothetical protein